MSIRVIIQADPFSADREIREFEGKYTINRLCKEFNIDYKETPIAVSINGEPTTHFRKTIKNEEKDTLVLIKVLPTGDDAPFRILGGVMVIAGVALIATGVGAGFGASMIFSGVTTFFAPEIGDAMLNAAQSDESTNSVTAPTNTQPSYLKGGRNSLGHNKTIPVVLGKHRYYPYQIAYPYTEVVVSNAPITQSGVLTGIKRDKLNLAVDELYGFPAFASGEDLRILQEAVELFRDIPLPTEEEATTCTTAYATAQAATAQYRDTINHINKSFDYYKEALPASIGGGPTGLTAEKPIQRLQQMYLWGHKEVIPDLSTIKREETPISTLTGTTHYYNATTGYGASAKKHVSVSKTLKKYSIKDGFTRYDVILPSNINSATISLMFGMFASVNTSDVAVTPITSVSYLLFDVDDPLFNPGDPATAVFTETVLIQGGDASKGTIVDMTAVNIPVNYALDTSKHYQVSVIRERDDVTNPDCALYNPNIAWYQTDIAFSHVLCDSPVATITPDATSKFNYSNMQSQDEFIAGEIDNFNAIVQTHVKNYTGVGSGPGAWAVEATSNPAAMYLYILQGSPNKRPVSDDEIDWEKLEEWHTFCETENLECNAVLENPGAVENILMLIALSGRAVPDNLNKYSVIIEKPRDYPTQLITDVNSFGLTLNRSLSDEVHAIKYSFINSEVGYQSDTITVYADGYTEGTATKIQTQEMVGSTTPLQVQKLGKYTLNCKQRLIETLTVSMDIEYVLCKRGDLVRTSHSQILTGLARGRVLSTIDSGADTIQIVLDTEVTMEVGKDYTVVVRMADGNMHSLPVVNTEDTTDTLTLVTPQPTNIDRDNVFSFGESGIETAYYTVLGVNPSNELTASLTLLNYDENVYSLGPLPPFVSNVSIPSDFGASPIIDRVYDPDTALLDGANKARDLENRIAPGVSQAIKTNLPPAKLIRSDALELQVTDEFIYFIGLDDSQLYRTPPLPGQTRELVIAKPIKEFCVDDESRFIIYSDMDRNNKLYRLDLYTNVELEITTTVSIQPSIVNNYMIYYINDDDGQKVYRVPYDGVSVPEVVIDFGVKDFAVRGQECIWRSQNDNNTYVKNVDDGDLAYKGEIFTTLQVSNLLAVDASLWEVQAQNSIPIYIDGDTQNSILQGEALYGGIIKHSINSSGYYAFITIEGNMYYASLLEPEDYAARLATEVTTDSVIVKGDTSYLGHKITNISVEDIVKFAWGDEITGVVFQADTKVTFVGSNYVELSKYALGDSVAGDVGITGTRLVLNANKVIIPGTVEAGLLATDAINSLDRVQSGPNAGEHIYEHNLATGVEIVRDSDGNVVKSFHPDTGLEITGNASFSGELKAGTATLGENFVVNPDGTIETTGATIDGDLIVNSDVNNRKVEVGTAGVKVTDSGARVVHDVPPTTTTNIAWAGHVFIYTPLQGLTFTEATTLSFPNENIIISFQLDMTVYGFASYETGADLINKSINVVLRNDVGNVSKSVTYAPLTNSARTIAQYTSVSFTLSGNFFGYNRFIIYPEAETNHSTSGAGYSSKTLNGTITSALVIQ
jgi:hypothetical protein